MKITVREKVMLLVLCIIALLALSYYLLFKPQFERLKTISIENIQVAQQVEKANTDIKSLEKLDEQIAMNKKTANDKTTKYYPEILQDRFVILLDGLVKKKMLTYNSGNYSQVTIEPIQNPTSETRPNSSEYKAFKLSEEYRNIVSGLKSEDETAAQPATGGVTEPAEITNQVSSLYVMVQLTGTYDQFKGFLADLEALKRSVIIKNIKMTKNDLNQIEGEVEIEFVSLAKLEETNDEFVNWPFNNTYGKNDPFN